MRREAQRLSTMLSRSKIRFNWDLDWGLVLPVIILLVLGFIMIISTSAVVGQANYNDAFFFIKKHAIYLFLGFIAFLMGFHFPHSFYKQIFPYGFACSLILLLLTLVPGFGVTIGGASRWLDLVFFKLQPVEVAKFFVVVFLSMSLENKTRSLKHFLTGCLPLLLVVCLPLTLLMLQPDLGNTGLIFLVTFALLFISPIPFRHLASLVSLGVIAVAVNIMIHPYQMNRIKAFMSPWEDPLGLNYHMVQSLISIGSGGLWGLGLGESKLKFFYLPLQYSDFIFSILCEEGGFILGSVVVVLFGFLCVRGFSIAVGSTSRYAYYLAIGLTLMVVLQAVINMSVVSGLMPVTGIPLTFMSFGGTSLITSMFYVGVLSNISKESK